MPTPSEEETKKLASAISSLVALVLSPLAVPVREFHRTVGHSTVSGATLIAIAAIACMLLYNSTRELGAPVWEAQELKYKAEAEYYGRIGHPTDRPERPTFTLATAAYLNLVEGIRLKVGVIPTAEKLFVRWTSPHGSGMRAFSPIPDPSDFYEAVLSADRLGAALSTVNNRIAFDFSQRLADGTTVKYTGATISARTPNPAPIE